MKPVSIRPRDNTLREGGLGCCASHDLRFGIRCTVEMWDYMVLDGGIERKDN
jgi:hypothetical protein